MTTFSCTVDALMRPIMDGCFQLFIIRSNGTGDCLKLVYEIGQRRYPPTFDCSETLYRELARVSNVREVIIMMNPAVEAEHLFDHLSEYFTQRVSRAVRYLSKDSTFALLRGSEVSLDRLVQLQNDTAATPSVKDGSHGTV